MVASSPRSGFIFYVNGSIGSGGRHGERGRLTFYHKSEIGEMMRKRGSLRVLDGIVNERESNAVDVNVSLGS